VTEPIWIDAADVLAIHDRQLVEHGGAEGLRDEGLLHSALGRPLNHFAYASSDIIERATMYTAGIVQNHPFVDGNKRTGFVVGVLFIELNGYRLKAREEAAAQSILELAAGTIDEKGLCAFLRANVERAPEDEPEDEPENEP
jgi:death-on-curing protein